MKISFIIPMTQNLLASEANLSEHWSVKRKRHETQRFLVRSSFNFNAPESIPIPCTIRMTRIAPRQLDEDNLIASFKWIKDTIADFIVSGLPRGRADGNRKMTWHYSQQKRKPKEYALEIEIEYLPRQNI